MIERTHSKLVSFIWSITDDCLRDVYVRGKYRDVILPLFVLRRLDALLEPSKDAVLAEVTYQIEQLGETELDSSPLEDLSGYVFYNTSKWTLKKIYETATNNQQILLTNVEDYLSGFSANVKEIIEKFELHEKCRHMAKKDVLLDVIEKFTSPKINLTPFVKEDPDGNKLPELSNLGMGYVFEELIRKFNEENNEEAGEHFTPREIIELMTRVVFDPVKDELPPVMTVYDPACGSGGMLTEAQNFIKDQEGAFKAKGDVYLFGKEINDETYAICKSDMMIKGNDPENILLGSTLSNDEFAGKKFDFMFSNPPYGKSWATEEKNIKDGKDIIDARFVVELTNYWGVKESCGATPTKDDGQLLFLMEMVSKMKVQGENAPLGSRIASIHNGSSLFTGNAGSGESNIRRFIIDNDLLEAIIQLPNNMFYNTGITTYLWLLSNNKSANRRGKVQLIDASELYKKLRKNLGKKNCEFTAEHLQKITQCYLNFSVIDRVLDDKGAIASQIFDNSDFGYHKVNIERPDRRSAQFTQEAIDGLRFDKSLREPMEWVYSVHGDAVYEKATLKDNKQTILKWCDDNELDLKKKAQEKLLDLKLWEKHQNLVAVATQLMNEIDNKESNDFNQFKEAVDSVLKEQKIKIGAPDKKAILNAVSWYDENAEKVIKKVVKLESEKLDELLEHLGCKKGDLADYGYYQLDDSDQYTTYEPSSDLRDSESVPLKDSIHDYFLEEVKPHVDEAWINLDSTKLGYEISFNKYFYQHKPLRNIDVVAKDIVDLEKQAEGLIAEILGISLNEVQV